MEERLVETVTINPGDTYADAVKKIAEIIANIPLGELVVITVHAWVERSDGGK